MTQKQLITKTASLVPPAQIAGSSTKETFLLQQVITIHTAIETNVVVLLFSELLQLLSL